jgi:hypothetical protein
MQQTACWVFETVRIISIRNSVRSILPRRSTVRVRIALIHFIFQNFFFFERVFKIERYERTLFQNILKDIKIRLVSRII